MNIIANLTLVGAIFGAIYYPMKCAEEDSRLKRILFGTIAFGIAGTILGTYITLVIALNVLMGKVMWGTIIGAIAGVVIGSKIYSLRTGRIDKTIANLTMVALAGSVVGTVIGVIIGLIPVSQSFWI